MGPKLRPGRATVPTALDGADAPALVAAAHALDDDSLARVLTDRGAIRRVLTELLEGLPAIAVSRRLARVHGRLLVEVDLADGAREHITVDLNGRRAPQVRFDDADPAADVVLGAAPVPLLRILTGESNAGLALLGGHLRVAGDTELALAVGGLFLDPRTGKPVEPRDLDPADVAGALDGVSRAHVREVMSSGFRAVVLDEVFGRLPQHLDVRRARAATLAIGFRLLGRPDGDVDRYLVRVADGRAFVESPAGRDVDHDPAHDATVTCDAADFLLLATGHLGAVTGVLRGRLKVRGDRAAALRLSGMMSIPRASEEIS